MLLLAYIVAIYILLIGLFIIYPTYRKGEYKRAMMIYALFMAIASLGYWAILF